MKRLVWILLVTLLVVACSNQPPAPAPETSTPTTGEMTPVTPVTPIDEHDHEHVGDMLSVETYQEIIDAAKELPFAIKYVDADQTAYGTELVGDEIAVVMLQGEQKEELYRVDKSTEWVDIKAKLGDELVIVEKNPNTQDGRVFLLNVVSKEDKTVIGDKVYHGPVTSNFVVRGDSVYFAYDEEGTDIALVKYDVATGELTTEVENAFDPKEHQGAMYYLQTVGHEVGLYRLTAEGETETVVDPGLNLYDYYFLEDRLDLLLYVVSQGDQFNFLRITDFLAGGAMNDYPFVKPIIWGEDVLVANGEHQTIVEHGEHIHAFPDNSLVNQDTFFTFETEDNYYFMITPEGGNRHFVIDKATLLGILEH